MSTLLPLLLNNSTQSGALPSNSLTVLFAASTSLMTTPVFVNTSPGFGAPGVGTVKKLLS